jgi:predicted acetyltransferase
MPFLIAPSIEYRDSYLEALEEFHAEDRQRHIARDEVAADFGRFIQHLSDQADHTKVETGLVPYSEFWLVDGEEYLGMLLIRHELDARLLQKGGHVGYAIRPSRRRRGYGKLILKYGLEEAKTLGLERVLLTCDEENCSSRRIIEANGGVLENIIQVEGWPAMVCRYWIQL